VAKQHPKKTEQDSNRENCITQSGKQNDIKRAIRFSKIDNPHFLYRLLNREQEVQVSDTTKAL